MFPSNLTLIQQCYYYVPITVTNVGITNDYLNSTPYILLTFLKQKALPIQFVHLTFEIFVLATKSTYSFDLLVCNPDFNSDLADIRQSTVKVSLLKAHF